MQGDQLYIAVCFRYLVKRDLPSVRYCTEYQNNTALHNWSGCLQGAVNICIYSPYEGVDQRGVEGGESGGGGMAPNINNSMQPQTYTFP